MVAKIIENHLGRAFGKQSQMMQIAMPMGMPIPMPPGGPMAPPPRVLPVPPPQKG